MSSIQDRHQAALEQALRSDNLDKFQRALQNGAKADELICGSPYTIFEMACKTQGRHEFISACLEKDESDLRLKVNAAQGYQND
ncbi:AGAP013463-PA-like protein [Anopheles sinensis]|uniref:AGAP013463-PA-like protein n=1 Tax=Anopheles sinensis TaxID=74873 RepID=A0A084W5D7_ANOSI|nr:AGAP013463-PA-like protein [Anopheles sinensis]